jgi:hypothetical protein|tara:strand:- start:1030 stop:1548 length:519 start_codon:yes stop_codon:yes gene_type:complete
MSIKLYTDKTEVFECNVALEGVSIKESKLRAILKFEDKNLMIEGKIKSGGKGQIVFPKLKGLTEDGQKGKMQLEVIAEDAYFQPYEEDFEVKTSKKATVEILTKSQSKPKIVVEKITPEMEILTMLKENGITRQLLVKNKTRFSKVLHNYYREANVQESFNVFLSTVIKRLD